MNIGVDLILSLYYLNENFDETYKIILLRFNALEFVAINYVFQLLKLETLWHNFKTGAIASKDFLL